jgi:hypothetical protein
MSGISAPAGAVKLDDALPPDDNTDLNATALAHGLLPKLPNDSTRYLNGAGAWDGLVPVDMSATNIHNGNLAQSFTLLRCTGADQHITGITINGGAPRGGDRVLILCLGTSVRVYTENVASTGYARIICPSASGQIVGAGGAMLLLYDGVASRWREFLWEPGAVLSPPFAAANYSSNAGAGGWLVDVGDRVVDQYIQRGRVLTYSIDIAASSVVIAGATQLIMALPNGVNGSPVGETPGICSDNGGPPALTMLATQGGFMYFYRDVAQGVFTVSVNATRVAGTIQIPIL